MPVTAIAVSGAFVAAAALAGAAPPPHNSKVTLCHATPPATAANGWVEITVSTNAVTHAGHGDHADDIIPAFTYYVKRTQYSYPGKNLGTMFSGSTGAEILANGCALPAPPPPPTTTSTTVAPPTKTHTKHPKPVVTTTHTVPAPVSHTATVTTTHTAPVHVRRTVTATHTAPVVQRTATVSETSTATSTTVKSVQTATVQREVDAVAAGPSGRAPQVAATEGIAAGETGDHGTGAGPSGGLLAAVVGGSIAALLGIAGLAFWRRRMSGAGA